MESSLYNLVGTALRAKGHRVASVDGSRVGGYQGILFTKDGSLPEPVFSMQSIAEDHPVNGVYRAGSDHRKDGQAVGW
jgi:gamma-glutamyltranspeptidase/glutathione hydrolase